MCLSFLDQPEPSSRRCFEWDAQTVFGTINWISGGILFFFFFLILFFVISSLYMSELTVVVGFIVVIGVHHT